MYIFAILTSIAQYLAETREIWRKPEKFGSKSGKNWVSRGAAAPMEPAFNISAVNIPFNTKQNQIRYTLTRLDT